MTAPKVSVVVCTYNRADSLQLTLASLERLAYPSFEVVVVEGPSTDHTGDVLSAYDGVVKRVHTAERNLSTARNLGIAASAGEVIAFIDDDAIPDGRWLDDLVPVFEDSEVGAAGGPVFDHTGYQLQARYSLADRWGDTHIEYGPRRLDYLDHPDTWYFPYTIGTNSLFRRDYLVASGGFDENYAFYLDETDVCLRLIERGYRVVPSEHGVVHHRFRSSSIRAENRVTVNRFNVLLSRAYFARRHGLPKSDELAMFSAFNEFVEYHQADLAAHMEASRIPPEVLDQFNRDTVEAWRAARARAKQPPLTRPRRWFGADPKPFLPFPTTPCAATRLRLCLVVDDYQDGPVAGIGRVNHALAADLAGGGHLVHVIIVGKGEPSTVDLEACVWVHRIQATEHDRSPVDALPQVLWDRAATVLDEVRRIDSFTPVDLVQVANCNGEGLALILDGHYRVCLYAYMPLLAVGNHHHRVDTGRR